MRSWSKVLTRVTQIAVPIVIAEITRLLVKHYVTNPIADKIDKKKRKIGFQ